MTNRTPPRKPRPRPAARRIPGDRLLRELERYQLKPNLLKAVSAVLTQPVVSPPAEKRPRGWPKGKSRNVDNPLKRQVLTILRRTVPKKGMKAALKAVCDKTGITYGNAYYYYTRVYLVEVAKQTFSQAA